MQIGMLVFEPIAQHPDLVAESTKAVIIADGLQAVLVSEIDAGLSDTAAFCEHYNIGLDISANCVIVEARRADKTWYAACMILATNRADINNVIRRHLDARKISFAPMDTAVALSRMEYGGITPIGLPADWPILVDSRVALLEQAVIGSGIRGSKLLTSGAVLAHLPGAVVLDIAKLP